MHHNPLNYDENDKSRSISGHDPRQEGLSLEHGIAKRYWRANLRLLGVLLSIWFAISFGCAIVMVDELNRISFFGFKLGFWFAQQGAIYGFIVIIAIYTLVMNRIEQHFGLDEKNAGVARNVSDGSKQ